MIHEEILACQFLLSEAGFFFEYPTYHKEVMLFLEKIDPVSFNTINSILFLGKKLNDTSYFMNLSSSQIELFLDKSEAALQCLSLHQSELVIEKIIRGMSKQIGCISINQDILERMHLILSNLF